MSTEAPPGGGRVEGAPETTARWRPQILWVPVGGLLGALAGGVTGAAFVVVVLLADDVSLSAQQGPVLEAMGSIVLLLIIGLLFGAVAGAPVGLAVGVQLMLLVGAHLPREVAQHRAHRLGFVLPPVTLVLLATTDAFLWTEDAAWSVVTLAGASLLGGPIARWFAGLQPPRTPVS